MITIEIKQPSSQWKYPYSSLTKAFQVHSKIKTKIMLKMAVFCDAALHSLVLIFFSEVLIASIIQPSSSTSETLFSIYRLCGATSQKKAIFILGSENLKSHQSDTDCVLIKKICAA
jgi:hypothetical protein